jgi:hypothetical protein
VEATAFNHGFQAMVAMKMKPPGMEIVQLIVVSLPVAARSAHARPYCRIIGA